MTQQKKKKKYIYICVLNVAGDWYAPCFVVGETLVCLLHCSKQKIIKSIVKSIALTVRSAYTFIYKYMHNNGKQMKGDALLQCRSYCCRSDSVQSFKSFQCKVHPQLAVQMHIPLQYDRDNVPFTYTFYNLQKVNPSLQICDGISFNVKFFTLMYLTFYHKN